MNRGKAHVLCAFARSSFFLVWPARFARYCNLNNREKPIQELRDYASSYLLTKTHVFP